MKLLIIEDHEVVRNGLKMSLSLENIFSDIIEASNIKESMEKIRDEKPDITLVDINLGKNENGFTIIRAAMKEQVNTKFVILTSSYRKQDFLMAKSLRISGYILKDSSLEDIVYGLRNICKGRVFYDSELEVADEKSKQKVVEEVLTERELEVFKILGKGLTNLQVAGELCITESTVKKHISSILEKLNLEHRTQAALFAAKLWRRAEDYTKQ